MREATPLDALFSRSVQGVLGVLLMDPGQSWSLSSLARHLERTASSLQGPLAALVTAGVLRKKSEANRVLYEADLRCPFLPELRGLIIKTAGLCDVLRRALETHRRRIACAFVYGSVARSEERAGSDIDLMIVGTVRSLEIAPALREAEGILRRPINATVYRYVEFHRKLEEGHHFLRAVMDKEKLFIIGDSGDLERTRGRKPRRTA